MSEQKPPLWEAMHRADQNVKLSSVQHDWPRCIKAAEIRALRDWLVPEDAPPPDGFPLWAATRWQERQRLRALLTAEADRAERGDQPTRQEH